jgi:hypothetical protein
MQIVTLKGLDARTLSAVWMASSLFGGIATFYHLQIGGDSASNLR